MLTYHLIQIVLIEEVQLVFADHSFYDVVPIFVLFIEILLLICKLVSELLEDGFSKVLLKL